MQSWNTTFKRAFAGFLGDHTYSRLRGVGAMCVSVGVLSWSSAVFAQAKPTSASSPAAKLKEDKVDVSDLENKYWAPKDTDFSVVQNRTYTKEKRLFATLQYGPIVNDKYSEGNNAGLTLNYFTSERFGLQATYLKSSLTDSEIVTALMTKYSSGVAPNFNRMQSYYGLGVNWVPFYAKMSFLGQKIIYFDMAITPTIGITSYDQMTIYDSRSKSALTYGIDFTQYFFLTNHFAIRADLKNQWHSEEVIRFYGTSAATGQKVGDRMNHTTLFLLGLTFFY